jgi:hypothetical protein
MPTLTIPPLKPFQLFTDKDGLLTKTAYDFLFGLFSRVGGSLSELNAVTLVDKTWDAPDPIGSTTPSTGKFTTLESTTALTVGASVTATGSGLKHVRISTGSIGAGVSALVTHTWATAFANANYTVSASVQDSTAATASLKVVHIETISATQTIVRVENTSAGSLTGTLHLIAMHD